MNAAILLIPERDPSVLLDEKRFLIKSESGTAVKYSVTLSSNYIIDFRATECTVNIDRARENNYIVHNQ